MKFMSLRLVGREMPPWLILSIHFHRGNATPAKVLYSRVSRPSHVAKVAAISQPRHIATFLSGNHIEHPREVVR